MFVPKRPPEHLTCGREEVHPASANAYAADSPASCPQHHLQTGWASISSRWHATFSLLSCQPVIFLHLACDSPMVRRSHFFWYLPHTLTPPCGLDRGRTSASRMPSTTGPARPSRWMCPPRSTPRCLQGLRCNCPPCGGKLLTPPHRGRCEERICIGPRCASIDGSAGCD